MTDRAAIKDAIEDTIAGDLKAIRNAVERTAAAVEVLVGVLDEERRLALVLKEVERELEVACMAVVKDHGDGTASTKGLGLALGRLKKAREDLKVAEGNRDARRDSERLRVGRVDGRAGGA